MKKIIAVMLSIILVLSLAACSKNTSDHNISSVDNKTDSLVGPKTMTLKEYLDAGPRVGFGADRDRLAKDRKPDYMYLFEEGKVYEIPYGIEDGKPKVMSSIAADASVFPTFGEIAMMTEEELLSFAREHKVDEWWYFSHVRRPLENYSFHIYTDDSGNNVIREDILAFECPDGDDYANLVSRSYPQIPFEFVIYDTTFSGFAYNDNDINDAFLFFVNNDGTQIVFDNIGDEGIEVD